MTTVILSDKKRQAEIKALKESIRLDEQKLAGQLQIKEQYVSTHLWEFYRPFRWQDRCGELCKNHLTILAPSPNGIGKTTEMVNRIMSWMAGYEAWSPVDADYPGAVKHDGKWYKPSSLGKKPPVVGRLTGNDWSHHLGQVVVKEMKRWFPMDEFDEENRLRDEW